MATANPPRPIQLRENPRVRELADVMYQLKAKYAAILPKGFDIDKMLRYAVTAVARNPDLQACTTRSILDAVNIAIQLGLDPTGVLGQAYLIPYKRTAQFQIGYRGLMTLARRSDEVTGIDSQVVYQQDHFEVAQGTNPIINHRPTIEGDPGPVLGAYAILRTRTGVPQHEWMRKADIDAIRRRARSGDSGPWQTDYPAMARKTALRRLLKYAPLKVEDADKAAAIEDRFEEEGEAANVADLIPTLDASEPEPVETRTKSDEMAERLRGARAEVTSQGIQPEGTGAVPSEDQTTLLPDEP